ncbi:Dihydrofolate reductase [Actinokineospora alba]|uniref:Dihydrofolate reductase n=1 Tax=Actinokineospora alba TaxID=504798 RepID=A0A1H0FEU4_9PSEU|nr:dihydrofolate reductase family protein [Actinokineospora alba]TDP69451.1 dihydrofolate reductase [Actinokineospora alba]SDI16546.1 Dihydrofolate reductase [Actinokineospora alba]SDN93136.1 Dihydrofolate reductase [Actinokineospora alba]
MTKLRVHCFSISLDGYAAGPAQSAGDPLGVRGAELHEWVFAEGRDPAVDSMMDRGIDGIGATIMGRNMFGPVRGPWEDDTWTGWWGPNPPYHHPVFVLTHHPRAPITMEGGTTFHFVDDGIESALAKAVAAANGQDVRLGGGASTVRQYLRAGLVDEMHLAVVPVLLGAGERLFDDGITDFECAESITVDSIAHMRLVKTGS